MYLNIYIKNSFAYIAWKYTRLLLWKTKTYIYLWEGSLILEYCFAGSGFAIWFLAKTGHRKSFPANLMVPICYTFVIPSSKRTPFGFKQTILWLIRGILLHKNVFFFILVLKSKLKIPCLFLRTRNFASLFFDYIA